MKAELARVSDRLDGLALGTKAKAMAFIVLASDQGIPVRVTSTRRTLQEQAALFAQGRQTRDQVNALRVSAGMPPLKTWEINAKVTNAQPGDSWHNWGRAFDVVPMQLGLKLVPAWASPWWKKLGEIGKAVGLEWGGAWTKPDTPHFQDMEGPSLAQLKASMPGQGGNDT